MKKNLLGSVYIETSVISYLVSKPSADLKIAAEQLLTVDWWNQVLPKLTPYISTFVLDEIASGDKNQSSRRKEAITSFEVLQENLQITELAAHYLKDLCLPVKSKVDAYHLAMATIFEMDFLVSWNCKHIANPFLQKKIEKINSKFNLGMPVICTPREMLGGFNENQK